VFAGALVAGFILALPAWASEPCGKPGYSYAGLLGAQPVHGISASISAPLTPTVQSGDVAGWIGVGRARVSGKRGSIRAGLLSSSGSSPQLFYEVRRYTTGEWKRFLGPEVAPGETHGISIRENPRVRGYWRVWIDGRIVSGPIKLRRQLYGKYVLATAESWDGGTPACNQFAFRFGAVRARQSGPWRRLATRGVLQDPGYAVVRPAPATFVAKNAPDPSNFAGDWETGDSTQWTGNHWNRNVPLSDQFQIVTDPLRQGHYTAMFTVRPGDKFVDTSGERSEVLLLGADEKEGDDLWYAWSTLFPAGWTTPSGWSIFAQWHSRYQAPPPVAFNVKDNQLMVNTNTGEVNANGTGTNKISYPFANTLSRGEWNDFVVHIVWTAGNGSITVWHRAGGDPFSKALDVSGIPTLQTLNAVPSANYLKVGLYRNDDPMGTDVLYQDGFHRAKNPVDLTPAFDGDPAFADLLGDLGYSG
jgi:polysaccharide lyase-like protein